MRKPNHLTKLLASISLAFILSCLVEAKGQTLFFYFVAPNAVISANFGGTLDAQNCPDGYAKVLITASNLAKFNSVAPSNIKYVYSQLQGTAPLRANVDLVLKNSGGAVTQVLYFLADDRTAITTKGIFRDYKDNGNSYIWPSAGSVEFPANSKKFLGVVMFGEHQLATDQSQRIGGMKAVDEVVLHESSHTQWTGSFTKWPTEGYTYTYGADNTHYFSIAEMLGDQEAAINEGIATFYGYIMNDSALQKLMNDYNSLSNRFFVEAQSVLAGSPGLYTVKERESDQLEDAQGNKKYYDSTGEPIMIFTYKWLDVPGWYLLFAESTSTAFFSIFRNHTYSNKDIPYNMIRSTSLAMSPDRRKRFLTYACNRLALRMEEYNNSSAGKADGSRVSSLFPFAVLDLVTHFGMSDAEFKDDYQRNNADQDPKAFNEYFARRAAIKALVTTDLTPVSIDFEEALDKIVSYCKQPANIL